MHLFVCPQCKEPSRGRLCTPCAQENRRQRQAGRLFRYDEPAYVRNRAKLMRAHIRQHGYRCPGWERPPHYVKHLSVDHIVPLIKGGTHHRQNLQVLCVECNSSKGEQ